MSFEQFSDNASYNQYRNELTAQFENYELYMYGTKNNFYFDRGGINIGFGFNITGNIDSARSALENVGITFTNEQWETVGRYATDPSDRGATGFR